MGTVDSSTKGCSPAAIAVVGAGGGVSLGFGERGGSGNGNGEETTFWASLNATRGFVMLTVDCCQPHLRL